MFEKSPICLKKWPIGSPYVGLPEAFLPHMLKKAPYVANRVPICGPYVPHMFPIGFDCSSDMLPCKWWQVCHINVKQQWSKDTALGDPLVAREERRRLVVDHYPLLPIVKKISEPAKSFFHVQLHIRIIVFICTHNFYVTDFARYKEEKLARNFKFLKLTGVQCQWSTEPKLGGNGSCERRLKSTRGSQKWTETLD